MTAPAGRVPRAAAWLGGLGLIPFLAGTAGCWLLEAPRDATAAAALGGYAAVILSFMGAIHWGLALGRDDPHPGASMTLSVIPALLAWFALALPAAAGLALMALGFAGVYAADLRAVSRSQAPAWYRDLRLPLTGVVLASLALAIIAILLRDIA